jgi:hypothetical protein
MGMMMVCYQAKTGSRVFACSQGEGPLAGVGVALQLEEASAFIVNNTLSLGLPEVFKVEDTLCVLLTQSGSS